MEWNDTICAPATVPGTGAITVIRLSGAESFAIMDKLFRGRSSVAEAPAYSILYGQVMDKGTGEPSLEEKVLDDVLVSVFRAPHSYTGEDCVELSCHASSYIAGRLMELLCEAGARPAEPGEFTRRAFVNGKMDLAQAEAVADVISSTSSASHRIALEQLKGGYSREIAGIRGQLLEITALLELELDFSEEEVEFAERTKLRSLVQAATDRIRSLAESFHLGNAIKNGVPVVIAGDPNVGKSTLLNALLGEDRAIVSDIAGTTRDSIEERLILEGIQFRFIDTAGLRETGEQIEIQGIARTLKMIAGAEIVLAMVDATAPLPLIRDSLLQLASRVDFGRQKMIVLVNKVDANKNVNAINTLVSSIGIQCNTLFISALEGTGLPALRNALVQAVKDRLSGLTDDAILVTNARHYEALRHAADSLQAVLAGLDSGIPSDLIAQDLREALHHLGTITGSITSDEVLGQIFERFCIGK